MQLVDFKNKKFSFKFEPKMWYKGGICSEASCSVCVKEKVMKFENLEKIGVLGSITWELNELSGLKWKKVLREKKGKVFPFDDQLPFSHTDLIYPHDSEDRSSQEKVDFRNKFQDLTLVQITLYGPFTILGFVDIDACYYPMIWDPMKEIEHDSKWWVSNGRSLK